jgi:hypothetical protein
MLRRATLNFFAMFCLEGTKHHQIQRIVDNQDISFVICPYSAVKLIASHEEIIFGKIFHEFDGEEYLCPRLHTMSLDEWLHEH